MQEYIIEKNKETTSKKLIKIYLCGPTVYDEVHIGNIRPSLLIDVVIKSLQKSKISFKYVQNITDVDDKIIKRSIEEGKKESEISEFYTKSYLEVLEMLRITSPEIHKVTDNIGGIINFIEKMVENKDAYVLGGNVIFNTKKWEKEYGELSNQKLENLSLESTRNIKKDPKINREDFVLWKKTEEGLRWKSPWIKSGRPGWHTECSTIINDVFSGETIEIHAGGKDLIFPHHENERIQYFSVNKKEICKKWLHFGHVNFGKEKMSKSLGNIISVRKYLEKYGANSLKILIFSSKYHEDIELSESKIEQSKTISEKIFNLNKKIRLFFFINKISVDKNFKNDFYIEMILRDLETSKLIFEMEKKISELNKFLKNVLLCENNKAILNLVNEFYFICDLIGISLEKEKYSKEEKDDIEKWVFFSRSRNFKESDQIRKKLQKKMTI